MSFTAGILIDTFYGPKRVEDLRPGDKLATLEAGLQSLDGVAHARQSPRQIDRKLVLLRRNALARGVPSRDTVVTADQMLRVPGRPLARVASLLDGRRVVALRPTGSLTFVDVLLDLPWTLMANGAPLSAQHAVTETRRIARAPRPRALLRHPTQPIATLAIPALSNPSLAR